MSISGVNLRPNILAQNKASPSLCYKLEVYVNIW